MKKRANDGVISLCSIPAFDLHSFDLLAVEEIPSGVLIAFDDLTSGMHGCSV